MFFPFVMSLKGFSLRVCAVIGPFIGYKYGGLTQLVLYLFVSFILKTTETEMRRHEL